MEKAKPKRKHKPDIEVLSPLNLEQCVAQFEHHSNTSPVPGSWVTTQIFPVDDDTYEFHSQWSSDFVSLNAVGYMKSWDAKSTLITAHIHRKPEYWLILVIALPLLCFSLFFSAFNKSSANCFDFCLVILLVLVLTIPASLHKVNHKGRGELIHTIQEISSDSS